MTDNLDLVGPWTPQIGTNSQHVKRLLVPWGVQVSGQWIFHFLCSTSNKKRRHIRKNNAKNFLWSIMARFYAFSSKWNTKNDTSSAVGDLDTPTRHPLPILNLEISSPEIKHSNPVFLTVESLLLCPSLVLPRFGCWGVQASSRLTYFSFCVVPLRGKSVDFSQNRPQKIFCVVSTLFLRSSGTQKMKDSAAGGLDTPTDGFQMRNFLRVQCVHISGVQSFRL